MDGWSVAMLNGEHARSQGQSRLTRPVIARDSMSSSIANDGELCCPSMIRMASSFSPNEETTSEQQRSQSARHVSSISHMARMRCAPRPRWHRSGAFA